jgi:hypothetical protein
MAGFFENFGNSLGSLTNNPQFIAALGQINPGVGQSLTQAALLQQQQQEEARRQQDFQNQQAEQQRAMMLQQKLPEILQNIDWSNPQSAQSALASAGLKPQEIATLFNIHAGNQELGFRGEEIGLKRQGLGLEQQAMSLRQQQLMNELAGGVSPSEAAKIEKELRAEVAKESGEYKTVKHAYNKVKEAASNPSAANDIALTFGFMKLIDPPSTVRESEVASAENAAGVPERIRNIYNKALSGQRLTPEQRADFVKSAKGQYKTYVINYKEVSSQYKNLAEKYQVNPENVVLFKPDELGAEEAIPQRGLQNLSNEEIQSMLQNYGR